MDVDAVMLSQGSVLQASLIITIITTHPFMLTRPVTLTSSIGNLGLLKPHCYYDNSTTHPFMLARPTIVTPSQANLALMTLPFTPSC